MIVSAGVIVVRKQAGNWQYLFLRAFRNWDFPKGEMEPGESFLEAAVRETREETGITELDFSWGEVFKETALLQPRNQGCPVLSRPDVRGSSDFRGQPSDRQTRAS